MWLQEVCMWNWMQLGRSNFQLAMLREVAVSRNPALLQPPIIMGEVMLNFLGDFSRVSSRRRLTLALSLSVWCLLRENKFQIVETRAYTPRKFVSTSTSRTVYARHDLITPRPIESSEPIRFIYSTEEMLRRILKLRPCKVDCERGLDRQQLTSVLTRVLAIRSEKQPICLKNPQMRYV